MSLASPEEVKECSRTPWTSGDLLAIIHTDSPRVASLSLVPKLACNWEWPGDEASFSTVQRKKRKSAN